MRTTVDHRVNKRTHPFPQIRVKNRRSLKKRSDPTDWDLINKFLFTSYYLVDAMQVFGRVTMTNTRYDCKKTLSELTRDISLAHARYKARGRELARWALIGRCNDSMRRRSVYKPPLWRRLMIPVSQANDG